MLDASDDDDDNEDELKQLADEHEAALAPMALSSGNIRKQVTLINLHFHVFFNTMK